jgi:hypothetical protein
MPIAKGCGHAITAAGLGRPEIATPKEFVQSFMAEILLEEKSDVGI